MSQFITPVERKRMERDTKICALYDAIRGDFSRAVPCYNAIAEQVGCSQATVITTLKHAGKI